MMHPNVSEENIAAVDSLCAQATGLCKDLLIAVRNLTNIYCDNRMGLCSYSNRIKALLDEIVDEIVKEVDSVRSLEQKAQLLKKMSDNL